MKLACIQLDTIPCEINLNVHKALSWSYKALKEGAKYVFLHEGLTADYSSDPIKFSRDLNSSEVYGFSELAKEFDAYIALGLNELYENKPYLSMVWLGKEGVIGVYRKSYLFPTDQGLGNNSFESYLRSYIPHHSGYRMERGIFGAGSGTKVIEVGGLRIGCLICADGGVDEAWETFRFDKPDLIFWQNNRSHISIPTDKAIELNCPIVVGNRCGFSYHFFMKGGACMVSDKGEVIAKANEAGKEEIIYSQFNDLISLV